jgi:Dolichyl-phosphate-mannose-protein mannosyltransferase
VSQRHYEPLSGGRSRIDWGITALMVAVFLVGFFWFTHGNQFPSFYHPEEEIRARQIINRDWDLHQPLLFAITTRVLKTGLHIPSDLQTVVQLGRTVSAFFAVGSIVCLGLVAYLLRNWAAAALLSFLSLCQHQFYDLAHTMSENTALMFGSSLTLLAIVLLERKASVARALFLGVSVAIAASAKYVGVLLFIPAFVAVLRSGGKDFRMNRIVEFGLGLLFAVLVINFFAVANLPRAATDWVQDLALAFGSAPYGVQSLLRGTYWLAWWHNTTPVIWLMLGVSLWAFWVRRRKLMMSEILLVLIPLVYFLLLLFSPPETDLRFLPMIGFTYTLAVVGVASAAELLSTFGEQVRGWLLPALVGVCLAACFLELLRGYPYFMAFNLDQRLEMLSWMDGDLPPGCRVVADSSVLLPNLLAESKRKYRFALLTENGAIDPDNLTRFDRFVAAGADYVVVCDSDYAPLFAPVVSVALLNNQSFEAAKQFHSEVRNKGTLIWTRAPGPVPYLQPGLKVYRLPKSGDRPGG